MREEIDTNSSYPDRDIPDGTYTFKVLSIDKKFGGPKKDKPFYVWNLRYEGIDAEQVLMPNLMGDLLKILGCTETSPGKFDWDREALEGKEFDATVSHAPDKKGKMRQNMGDFKASSADVPF